ncbi:MAG: hypothetical protein HQ466_01840 [Cryomorphaceae bacterium]|nr:hypothetical protein [Cryomorphaceae bacterium]
MSQSKTDNWDWDAIEEAAQIGRESPLSSTQNVKQMLNQILEAAKH